MHLTQNQMGFFLKKSGIINFEIYLSSSKYMWKYSTGLKIDPKSWDKVSQRPRHQRGEQGTINNDISDVLNEYAQVLNELKKIYSKGLTGDILRQEFDRHFKKITAEKISTASDYFDLFITQKKESQSVQRDSWQKYTRIHDCIKEMQKKNKITYHLNDFDTAFFMEYIGHMRSVKEMSDNTLKRSLGYFKSFLNWCVRNEYTVNKAYKDIKIKSRETHHVALSLKDLDILENLKLDNHTSWFRDLFLIGCYSGQRVSDYSRFDKKHIQGNVIMIRAKKTGQFSYIPLNPKLLRLLDKYDWKLTKINKQDFNVEIHRFCKIAGFDEIIIREKFYGNKKTTEEIPRYKLIASHTARRTFITISDDKGVPISATMNVCGIRSIKTYQNYCRLNKETMTQAVIEAWT